MPVLTGAVLALQNGCTQAAQGKLIRQGTDAQTKKLRLLSDKDDSGKCSVGKICYQTKLANAFFSQLYAPFAFLVGNCQAVNAN